MEDSVLSIFSKPLSSAVKDVALKAPHQHDVEHAVVRDENVRRSLLHVPSRPHLRAIRILKVIENSRVVSSLGSRLRAGPLNVHHVDTPLQLATFVRIFFRSRHWRDTV